MSEQADDDENEEDDKMSQQEVTNSPSEKSVKLKDKRK